MREPRTRPYNIRLTSREVQVLNEEAERRGTTVAALLREAMRALIGQERFQRERAA